MPLFSAGTEATRHRQNIAMAVGGTLVVIGATAVIGAALAVQTTPWFGPLIVGGVILMALGVYSMIFVPVLGAPFPEPRDEFIGVTIWKHVFPPKRPGLVPTDPTVGTPPELTVSVGWAPRTSLPMREVAYFTQGRRLWEIKLEGIDGPITVLHFHKPVDVIVRDLPQNIEWGQSSGMTIKGLSPAGFLVDEFNTSGEEVRLEVYWDKDRATFLSTREGLGELMFRGRELARRPVKDGDAFGKWWADYEAWANETNSYLIDHLSLAHGARFQDFKTSATITSGGFNEAHNQALGALSRFRENLRAIFDQYVGGGES